MTDSEEPYKVVDLFSGAGGFSIGFDRPEELSTLPDRLGYTGRLPGPGFKTIGAVEYDEDAAETFRENFPDADVREGNITEMESFEEWSDADVIIGGPPCQGFSQMNSTKTDELDDPRNELWREYMRAVDDIDPEFFIIENVDRFLTSGEGQKAYEAAIERGYATVVNTLWAHEHGVPQKRKRAFIFASKRDLPFFPKPEEEWMRTVHDAIGDIHHESVDEPLSTEPEGQNWHKGRNVKPVTTKRMNEVAYAGDRRDFADKDELNPPCWQGDHSGHTDCYGRLEWEEPSVTIRTGFYDPMKGRHVHPRQDRSITPREGARLQTFPDTHEFKTRAKTTFAQQVGNAVPPKLAYEFALAVTLHLDAGVNGEPDDEADRPHQSMMKSKPRPVHALVAEQYE